MVAPLVSDVFPLPTGVAPIRDYDITTTCRTCEQKQSLGNPDGVVRSDTETIYNCKNGCGAILKVAEAEPFVGKGGYRLGDWTIRNPRDVNVTLVGNPNGLLLPAPDPLIDFD
jgi:hypothetical protein